jgi:two-component system, OmpR family, heavy metal sensor histidine kinase CusS
VIDEASLLRERFAHLAHDIRNPLTVIISTLDYVGGDSAMQRSDIAEALSDARHASQRLLGMLRDLVDMSRAEEGRLKPAPGIMSMDAILAEVACGQRIMASQQKVTIQQSHAPSRSVVGDRELTGRVINNIMNNALRYAPPGSCVVMGTCDGDRGVTAFIENAGPSIPDSLKARLFDKYGQPDATGSAPVAQGLGLYFCRLAMEAQGGSIAVMDRPGGGVRFEVTLKR